MRIVRTTRYARDLRRIGATDVEAVAVEDGIAANPTAGDVIPGLRGIRKVRFRLRNKGKSGGGRAIYYLLLADDVAVMLMAYAKNEQADLTPAQRKTILDVLKELEDE